MRIADNMAMIALNLGSMSVHTAILFDQDSWTLVDTGMPGSAPAIRELAKQEGVGDLPLKTILLTHQDIDHIGGLPGFQVVEAPTVFAHPDDSGAINGTQPMIKVSQERMATLLQNMPEAVRLPFERAYLHPTRPNVDRTFTDGETLPIAGGLVVIHTPGHTPGHVSLYHQPSKTLIAGDASVAKDGELMGPNPSHTPNMAQAIESLKKLLAYDIENIICYHGGLVQGNIRERLAKLVDPS
jgi:glyoxylase-like metal-dependent hydrolase (beta-lactamase superfamily II)